MPQNIHLYMRKSTIFGEQNVASDSTFWKALDALTGDALEKVVSTAVIPLRLDRKGNLPANSTKVRRLVRQYTIWCSMSHTEGLPECITKVQMPRGLYFIPDEHTNLIWKFSYLRRSLFTYNRRIPREAWLLKKIYTSIICSQVLLHLLWVSEPKTQVIWSTFYWSRK